MGASVGSAFAVTIAKAVAVSLGAALVITAFVVTFALRRRRRALGG
jgi:hypothetical protein